MPENGVKVASAPSDGNAKGVPAKSKAELKAERRAIQEAQRAAKQRQREQQQPQNNTKPVQKKPQKQQQNHSSPNEEKSSIVKKTNTSSNVEILSHLKQYSKDSHPTRELSFSSSPVHPAFVRLGIQYAQEIVVGSNARCAALICAVKSLVSKYNCPKTKDLRSHLNVVLKHNFQYLDRCRKVSVSMENFIKHIKFFISERNPEDNQKDMKDGIMEECDRYFKESIYLAAEAISELATKRIEDGDTILIFNRSQLVVKILLDAHKSGKKFRVMVTDSRPDLRGILACERLTAAGIPVSYIYINSVTYAMTEVTKVLLAAEALLANGYVIGPVGTGMISLVANTYNIPVIVCCETYKFSERVQTDSILFNELADPCDILSNVRSDVAWQNHPNLHLVNLVFDATPPKFISIVITEVAELPCSSAPVILRKQLNTCY